MKTHLMWIVLILPFAIASEDLLKVFQIHDLESLSSCQQIGSACPINKKALLNLVENIYHQDTIKETPSTASPGIDTVKLKLKNHLASGSLIYLVMQIYGPSLTRREFQRLKELRTIANNSFANDLKTIKQVVDKEILQEKKQLDQKIDIIIKEIEQTFTNQEQRVDPIAAEIDQDQYVIAMIHFYQLNNAKMFIPLTERTKDNEKYLKFVKLLPSLTDRMLAYKAALAKSELGYSVFMLKRDIKLLQSEKPVLNTIPAFSNTSADFKEFNNELERRVSRELDQIAALILTGKPENYSDFITYTENHEELFNERIEDLLECITITDYSYEQTLNALIHFSNALTKLSLSARAYLTCMSYGALYDGAIVRTSYVARKIANNGNYPRLPKQMRLQLEDRKRNIPLSFETLYGHNRLCIRNFDLPVGQDFLHRDPDSSVIISSTSDLWGFEFSDKDLLFKIRHAKTNEYLIMTRNVSGNESRKIFTSPEHDNQLWNLEHFQFDHFLIKHEMFNEYLTFDSNIVVPCVDEKSSSDKRKCHGKSNVWIISDRC